MTEKLIVEDVEGGTSAPFQHASGESEENHKKLQSRQFRGQELNPRPKYDTG